MKNINVIAIIGKGYVSHINFNEVTSFMYDTDQREAHCTFKHLDEHKCYHRIKYKNVIEVNYLGE